MIVYKVYRLVCPIEDRIRYIGITKTSLEQRLNGHLNQRGKKRNTIKDKWIKELLIKNTIPKIQLIQICTEYDWEDRERYWIKFYRDVHNDLLNITDGGFGGSGYKHTEEWKKENSERHKGNNYTKGKKRTKPYTWQGEIPYRLTKETIADQEAKRLKLRIEKGFKTRAGSKGLTTHILQFDKKGNFIAEYYGTAEAARAIGRNRKGITTALSENRPSAFGFVWKFKYPKESNAPE